MAIKFIQKNKDGEWIISNSKSGKILRKVSTQKEAIQIAGGTKTTEGIMIKRDNVWARANGWDESIANQTIVLEKKPAVEKVTPTKVVTPVKKPVAEKVTPTKVVTPVKKSKAKKVTPTKVVTPVKKSKAKKVTPTKVVTPLGKSAKSNKKISKLKKKSSNSAQIENTKPAKKIKGIWGLLMGVLIIGVVIGSAFLMGQYL